MRAQPALDEDELRPIEDWFLKQVGRKKIFKPAVASDANLNHTQVLNALLDDAPLDKSVEMFRKLIESTKWK